MTAFSNNSFIFFEEEVIQDMIAFRIFRGEFLIELE